MDCFITEHEDDERWIAQLRDIFERHRSEFDDDEQEGMEDMLATIEANIRDRKEKDQKRLAIGRRTNARRCKS